ncbi:MAG: AMP-binding protein, partial [Alphaproteobacteria bacterium]|nr:AMP-binding protein [Alphaproteobacteria bacterium]
MSMSPTSLAELIDHGGSNTALIYRDRPISIGELADLSRRLAGGLKNLGIGAGDRIALWMPNVPAYLGLLFACARLGAIAVSVNTRFRAAEVGDIISRSGAKALVLWPGFLGVPFLDILKEVEPARLAGIETVVVYGEEGEAIPGLPFQPKRIVAYDTLAATMPLAFGFPEKNTGFAIFTTSGTTKAPKFVLQGQQGVAAHGFNVARGFGYL